MADSSLHKARVPAHSGLCLFVFSEAMESDTRCNAQQGQKSKGVHCIFLYFGRTISTCNFNIFLERGPSGTELQKPTATTGLIRHPLLTSFCLCITVLTTSAYILELLMNKLPISKSTFQVVLSRKPKLRKTQAFENKVWSCDSTRWVMAPKGTWEE